MFKSWSILKEEGTNFRFNNINRRAKAFSVFVNIKNTLTLKDWIRLIIWYELIIAYDYFFNTECCSRTGVHVTKPFIPIDHLAIYSGTILC